MWNTDLVDTGTMLEKPTYRTTQCSKSSLLEEGAFWHDAAGLLPNSTGNETILRNSKVKSKKYRFYCDENEYTENGCKCNYQCHINRKYDPTNDLFIVYNGATIDNSDLKQAIPTKSQCVKLYSEIKKNICWYKWWSDTKQ